MEGEKQKSRAEGGGGVKGGGEGSERKSEVGRNKMDGVRGERKNKWRK